MLQPTKKWKQHLEKHSAPAVPLEALQDRIGDIELKIRHLDNAAQYLKTEIDAIKDQLKA